MEIKFCNAVLVTGSGILNNASFSIEDGYFTNISVDNSGGYDLGGHIVIPGFIDSHIHGLEEYDFDDPDCDFEAAAARLKELGTTSFFAAISPFTALGERKKNYKSISCTSFEGFHLEGPYINPSKKGGFYEGQIRRYDPNEADDIFRQFNGQIRIVTAAPECVHLPSLYGYARKYNFQLSAGHTQANLDIADSAFHEGFTRATHLFNAMSGLDHRSPGILEAVFLNDDVHCEIIVDLHHVSLQTLQILLRIKSIEKLTAVTDSVCADIPGITVRDHMAYIGDIIYGSQRTMYDIFIILTQKLHLSLPSAVKLTSVNVGKALNLNTGDIAPGMKANFIIMDEEYRIGKVFVSSEFTIPNKEILSF